MPAPPEAAGAPRRAPCVFLCRDTVLEGMLDALALRLQRVGVDVRRGPAATPGRVGTIDPELLGDADVAMFSSRWQAPRALLAAAPRLHAVVNPTIGLDTVDLAAADELGLVVGHGATPENFIGMAEATVMLVLALRYGLHRSERLMDPALPRPPFDAMHARLLRDATVGLLGVGRIGRAVLQRLLPFGARLLACSPSARQDAMPAGVEVVGFERLMRESDVVCVLIAVTPHNRGLVGEQALGWMKRDAYLVNVARGDAIDEAALIRALQQRRIAGAALDTFAVEPLPAASPLRALDNVILTPHIVGHTREGNASLGRAAWQNLARVLTGELPLHCKNPAVLARWQARRARIDATFGAYAAAAGLRDAG